MKLPGGAKKIKQTQCSGRNERTNEEGGVLYKKEETT